MKAYLLITLFLVFILGACEEACISINGSGELASKTIEFNSFTSVKADISGNYILHRGQPKITVTTDDNLIDYLNISLISGDKLNITAQDLTCFHPTSFEAEIYADSYHSITSDGDCQWTSDPLTMSPKIIMNGSGFVKLTGKSSTQILINNADGEINMTDMPTKNVDITQNGTGDIKAKVSADAKVVNNSKGDVYIYDIYGVLDVTIRSSGNVYYSGKPSKIITVIQASGKLIEM